MSANRLQSETSPYLLQHKDNPVDWRPWGPEALAEAAHLNKPILVSVGYAACHWCHVMAHESFEDPETAALMNELYVCVKVDREERPDIDQWLQTMLLGLGVGGGWPLTAFLTPKAEPFTGGTYFPKESRYGRIPFKQVLREIAKVYTEQPAAVQDNVTKLAEALDQISNQNRAGAVAIEDIDNTAVRVGQSFDIFYGGLTGAPKFPNVPLIELLWRAYLRTGINEYNQLVTVTLNMMCLGGIYDHLGGGFSRYSTDDRWLLPHFEKMLYDNVQLLDVLTLVWQHNRSSLYREHIEETIDWLLTQMRVEDAGFASSIDADSEGEEGRYYLWTDEEVSKALSGTLAQRFKDAYDVLPEGNCVREGKRDGSNVLHRLRGRAGFSDADENLFVTQRKLLRATRENRVAPARDDKVLADWNGLAIAALVRTSLALQRHEWADAAAHAFEFVLETLSDGDHLFHSYRAGKHQAESFADDYAAMIGAALALFEITGNKRYLDHARAWTHTLNRRFWDEAQSGYRYAAETGGPVTLKLRNALDSQTPAANGLMVSALARLYFATGDHQYAERANTLLTAFAGDIQRSYLQMGTFVNGFEFLATGLQIVIVGERSDPRTQDLIEAVLGRSLPNRFLLVVPPGEALPLNHPAFGKTMQNDAPTAYICQQAICSAPITSAVVLAQSLLLPVPRAKEPH